MQITGLGNLDTSNAVAMAVAKKALQADRAQGQAMIEMLKNAMATSSSAKASPDGVGRRVDISA